MAMNQIPYSVNCNLCGCTGASVRCSKCNSMAFCIGCDDMYHRHPKRRQHLRQAVALEYIEFMENPKQQPQQQKQQQSELNSVNSLYPWRMVRTLPRNPYNDCHPSKMPIPPPRRKKKNYFIAGIKDTLKKWVNSPVPCETKPSINYSNNTMVKQLNNSNHNNKQQNEKINLSSSFSAFRPLPSNNNDLMTRKNSLQLPQNVRTLNTRQFATSTMDLSSKNQNEKALLSKRSSLPRKNFSQQEFQNDFDNNNLMFSNFHGSTQSMYVPNNNCNNHPANICCSSSINHQCNHCSHHHCHCSQQKFYNYDCFNHQKQCFSNSFEELNRNQKYYDDNNDDFDTDDENDLIMMKITNNNDRYLPSAILSRDTKNRIRRAKMKRSQSTYTMYGNNFNNFDDDDDEDEDEYMDMNSRTRSRSSSIMRDKIHSSSPSSSIKSAKSFSEPYRYSDVSDSSSSSQSRNKRNDINNNHEINLPKNEEKKSLSCFNQESRWSCSYCTFMNDLDRNVCEICCKTRVGNVGDSLMQSPNNNKRVSLVIDDKSLLNEVVKESLDQNKAEKMMEKEQEILFDESFVRQQMEIEKELQQRRENELKIKKENEKIDESTKKTSIFPNNKNEKVIDHEAIVAKMIEDKITEQFGKLKLSPIDDDKNISSTKSDSTINTPFSISSTPNINQNNQQQPQFYQQNNSLHQRTPSSLSNNNSKINYSQSLIMDPQPYHQIYQQQQQYQNSDLCSLNRYSSFDDLQSMCSTSSLMLFYPDSVQNSQKLLINSSKQMIQILRDAEKKGYTADDLEAALNFDAINPLEWLEKNWKNLCNAVMTMTNKQIIELECANGNKIDNLNMINEKDAKIALRLCKGNLWQAIQKCVQRYQENKLFDNSKYLPSKSEFFAMKVTGLGSGRANNDANDYLINNINNQSEELNQLNNSKLPIKESTQSESLNKNELLELYLKNIKDSKKLDYNELQTLIQNWQQEKESINYEREQQKIHDRERQKMQKLIDVQRKIGGSGYSSDGTTTEEELDKEVARVFQNRRQSSLTESESDRTPTFTAKEMDLFINNFSSPESNISDLNNNNNNNDKKSQIKQRIESKLNELITNRSNTKSSNDENVTIVQQASPISFTDDSDENFTDAITEIILTPSSSLEKIDKLSPKQSKSIIVKDQIYSFMATSQPILVKSKKYQTGNLISLISPKIQDKIIKKQNAVKIISSTEHDKILKPMFTGDPIVVKKSSPSSLKTIMGPSSSSSTLSSSPSSISILSSSLSSSKKIKNNDDQYSYEFQWARTELECELCATILPVHDIVVMITCTHYACRNCMKNYLTIQIREQQRLVITCPFCDEPNLNVDQDEQLFNYLAIFDPFIRHIIDKDVYELFQRKMRDRALMRDPNFMWCVKCSSGFIVPNPKALTIICPDCRYAFCRTCKKQWKNEHLNRTCEQFSELEKDHDIDYAEHLLNKHLEEFGIECPNCHFRYQLAKGGCMHFRCIQCSYDFCGGCYRPFKLGSRCFRAKLCERLGLHAHHPRNCLFYLRDKEISDLQKLLDEHKIEYKTTDDNSKSNDDKNEKTDNQKMMMNFARCQVMEQKEINFAMKDRPCNRFVEMAGLCKLHYKEYLGNIIYRNKIDPISILTESELELTLKRENIRIPTKIRGEDYIAKLKELIVEKIPLDNSNV